MKISYVIGTHNEGDEIDSLLSTLLSVINTDEDEILIVDDFSTDPKTVELLSSCGQMTSIRVLQHALNKDFSTHKNFMNDNASGDFIFNIDADEYPSDYLVTNIKGIIQQNPTIDLFWVPRVNVVEDITEDDIKRWGWNVNEKGYVNWPDLQGRIYRKSPDIRWKNKVHEVLSGFKQYATLPLEESFALFHVKSIAKQRSQNEFYSTI